ncbi:hypothetical protein E4U47_002030 [Claviceps purpurea]|nr:hypothetical protein E4U37_001742 [Claviceps purpurea]KAG6174810.1 hypothetical protein E4U51_000413 [Claviceps purpurea]KAG6202206.1 hypothetical protein E4U10_000058 [Claviceps purpurea]KAG6234261.1 hypothetical protein E4U26_004936 [Claviceps purpurea]KAG6274357.1 hypothetical protein E4U49_003735 [Claviceps purpurea]
MYSVQSPAVLYRVSITFRIAWSFSCPAKPPTSINSPPQHNDFRSRSIHAGYLLWRSFHAPYLSLPFPGSRCDTKHGRYRQGEGIMSGLTGMGREERYGQEKKAKQRQFITSKEMELPCCKVMCPSAT